MSKIHGAEVAKHNGKESCWVVIHDKVWDVTEFLAEHPGGAGIILKSAGKDATESYDEIHDPELVSQTLGPKLCRGSLEPGTLPSGAPKAPAPSESAKPAYPPLSSIVNVDDFEKVAVGYLSPTGWAYYSSGAEDEISMAESRRLFRKVSLRPRVLRRVSPVSADTNILGFKSSLPIYISPTGIGRYAHPNAEAILAKVAGQEGIIYCMPTTAPVDAIFAARTSPDQPLFFQLYAMMDRERSTATVRRAEELGAKAIFMTVDSPVIGRRERDERITGSNAGSTGGGGGVARAGSASILNPLLTWDDVAWLRGLTKLPVVIKGIQTVEDAVLAFRSGVQGIVLSNHGGRSQDTAQAPLLTLLEINRYAPELVSDEVRPRFQIFLDGGIRRGTDVLKALAMGASAVGIGRPFLYSLTNEYGEDGVRLLVNMLKGEIHTNLALLGATSVKEVVPEMVNVERVERYVSRRVKL